MKDVNEREVFRKAQDGKAHLNRLQKNLDIPSDDPHLKQVKHNLEIIARRADPAADPDYDPQEGGH